MTNDLQKPPWTTPADRLNEATSLNPMRVHGSGFGLPGPDSRSEEHTSRDHEPPDASLRNPPSDERVPPEVFLG